MNKRVLTVDDSKTLRMIVTRYLKPFGVEILEADNGSVGFSKAQAEKPDLILLDYNMPVMDGYQTLEALKQAPDTRSIPVIMLTTETVKETVVKLIKLGLKDYIAKPFSREALLSKVNPVLGLYAGDVVPDVETRVETAPVADGKRSVLIVDDKPNVIHLLTEFLGDDFRILAAENGQSAISMINSSSIDLLFLDSDLPDVSGLEVYRHTKNTLDARKVKVVGMMLRTAQAEVYQARQAGIREFLHKPFTKADVTTLIAGLEGDSDGSASVAGRFLRSEGSARVLSFPGENDPILKVFAGALGSDIPKALNDMADEGITRLVIELTPAVAADFGMVKKFISLLDQVATLKLSLKLVSVDPRTRDKLRQFSETAEIQTFGSLEAALNSFVQ